MDELEPGWVPVWLVRQEGDKEFTAYALEGKQNDDTTWTVNIRGRGCRSKQYEVFPDAKVYKSEAEAARRIQSLTK